MNKIHPDLLISKDLIYNYSNTKFSELYQFPFLNTTASLVAHLVKSRLRASLIGLFQQDLLLIFAICALN